MAIGGPTLGTGWRMAGAPGAFVGRGMPPVAGGPGCTTTGGATEVVVVVVTAGTTSGVTALRTTPTWVTVPPLLTPTGSMRTTVRVRPLPAL